MSGRYRWDRKANAVEPAEDPVEWARWFGRSDRQLADWRHGGGESGTRVSTVFLSLDHDHSGKGPPVLWETLVFGGPLADEMERYCTREEALAGHAAMVARVEAALAAGEARSGG